jgi:hypothetical protein
MLLKEGGSRKYQFFTMVTVEKDLKQQLATDSDDIAAKYQLIRSLLSSIIL